MYCGGGIWLVLAGVNEVDAPKIVARQDGVIAWAHIKTVAHLPRVRGTRQLKCGIALSHMPTATAHKLAQRPDA